MNHELPYNINDNRMETDPFAVIEAAQAQAEEQRRVAAARQSVEGWVGSLENPDPAALESFKDFLNDRPAKAEDMPSEDKHYNETMQVPDSKKHRDELLFDWAEADVFGDKTRAYDVQNELLNRVNSLKHVPDAEKERMLTAQTKKMEAIKDKILGVNETEETEENKVVSEAPSSEDVQEEVTDVDSMTDSEILNMDADSVRGLSKEGRQEWERRAAAAVIGANRTPEMPSPEIGKKVGRVSRFLGKLATKVATKTAAKTTKAAKKVASKTSNAMVALGEKTYPVVNENPEVTEATPVETEQNEEPKKHEPVLTPKMILNADRRRVGLPEVPLTVHQLPLSKAEIRALDNLNKARFDRQIRELKEEDREQFDREVRNLKEEDKARSQNRRTKVHRKLS